MNRIQPCTKFTRGLFSRGFTITAIAASAIASSIPMAEAGSCRTGYVDVRRRVAVLALAQR